MSEQAIQSKTARFKLSCTVDIDDLPPAQEGIPTIHLTVQSQNGVAIHAILKRKNYAKAYRTAQESPTGAFLIVQGNVGRIEGAVIELTEAGLTVAPKKPKPESESPADA